MRPIYVGATANAHAGMQIEWGGIPAAGLEFFVGYRLSRWFSFEGFYAFRTTFDPMREPGAGAICSGLRADWWNWHLGGARFWAHVVHHPLVDLSVAPSVGAGIGFDHNTSIASMPICGSTAPIDSTGLAFSGGNDERRPHDEP